MTMAPDREPEDVDEPEGMTEQEHVEAHRAALDRALVRWGPLLDRLADM